MIWMAVIYMYSTFIFFHFAVQNVIYGRIDNLPVHLGYKETKNDSRVLHTLWRQLYLFAYFDHVRNVAHFLLELANFKAGEKNLYMPVWSPNYKSEDHRLQYFKIKK